jgi:hypothetical protein
VRAEAADRTVLGHGEAAPIKPKMGDASFAEVSAAEELMWLADRNSGATPFFDCSRNLGLVVRLEGRLQPAALDASLRAIVARHEVLHSRYVEQDGRPVRMRGDISSCGLAMIDGPPIPREHTTEFLREVVKPHLGCDFDLAAGPLLRATLVALDRDEHILVVAVHHIVFDRWSRRLLEIELKRFYEQYVQAGAIDDRPLPTQYCDYVFWQNQQIASERGRRLTEYWLGRLGNLPPFHLPFCSASQDEVTSRSGTCWFSIPADEVGRMALLSRQVRATPATIMLAIFVLFLYEITGIDDLVVGVPLSDRRRPEWEELIGLFMNTVAVRATLSSGMTFLDVIDRVRRSLVDACLHQDFPYGHLLRLVDSRPAYRVIFNFLPKLPDSTLHYADVNAEVLHFSTERLSFANLGLHVRQDAGALECRLVYKADLFSPDCAQEFANQIQRITRSLLDAPEGALSAP